ncbi:hypothetical protein PV05_06864 [Exophiala xenobiotica]|uniref:Uncharacterized protein n=1 Tax=Exophiala xenobiotica TaxID=348802 RepID=A0A0D2F3S0_9EURO|nr:uncharacterized protein PV05_06864 [Exophiala xenobiotica]KIW54509.1 hypothetical protein PV05_06864 [Exophiala xenobiotica]
MSQAGHIISFIILVIVIGLVAVVGLVAYQIAHDVGHNTKQKLEKKNVSFSRDGMKVGVKERTLQHEEDAAQSVITKIWNNASWPEYKSRLGWGQSGKISTPTSTPTAEKRNPYSRSSSAQSAPSLSRHGSGQANLSKTTSATAGQR